jgi:hypothetical protein
VLNCDPAISIEKRLKSKMNGTSNAGESTTSCSSIFVSETNFLRVLNQITIAPPDAKYLATFEIAEKIPLVADMIS